MAEHTEIEETPQLGEGSRLDSTENGKEELVVLKEAEGELGDVRTENGEDTHGDEGTGMAVTAAPAEGEQALPEEEDTMLTNEEGTVPAEGATTPELARGGPSTEESEGKRKPLEPVSEPCKSPLLGEREQKDKSGSVSDRKGVVIPKGKPKSGRIWKDKNKKRFSGMVKDRSLHTSWDKKMAARREKSLVKDFSQRLKDEKRKAKEEKKRRREENLKRRLENERKGEVVQVITNLAKLKRAKKKQLRRIEKRDTLALVQRGSGISKKTERLAKFLKKKKETTEAKENTN